MDDSVDDIDYVLVAADRIDDLHESQARIGRVVAHRTLHSSASFTVPVEPLFRRFVDAAVIGQDVCGLEDLLRRKWCSANAGSHFCEGSVEHCVVV